MLKAKLQKLTAVILAVLIVLSCGPCAFADETGDAEFASEAAWTADVDAESEDQSALQSEPEEIPVIPSGIPEEVSALEESEAVPEQISVVLEENSKEAPEEIVEEVSIEVSEEAAEGIPEEIAEVFLEDVPEVLSEENREESAEAVGDEIPEAVFEEADEELSFLFPDQCVLPDIEGVYREDPKVPRDPEIDEINEGPFDRSLGDKALNAASRLIPFGPSILQFIKQHSDRPSDISEVAEDVATDAVGFVVDSVLPGASSIFSVLKDAVKKLFPPVPKSPGGPELI